MTRSTFTTTESIHLVHTTYFIDAPPTSILPLNTMCTYLLDLAAELLEHVLSFLQPRDLASFGRTCRTANTFIRPSNQILWRAAFLQLFDDPRVFWDRLQPTARAANHSREAHWDWFGEVRRRCIAFHAVYDSDRRLIDENLEELITTLTDVLETSLLYDTSATGSHERASLNLNFLAKVFNCSPFSETIVHDYHQDMKPISLPQELMSISHRPFTRSMMPRRTVPVWASRFHVYYGLTKRELTSSRAKAAARSIVYNWNVTGPDADYGPFKKDRSGVVNWQVVEAISSLMLRCFEKFKSPYLRVPSTYRDNVPYLTTDKPSQDWARVSRSWLGTYSFLDYRDLVHYNFVNNAEHSIDLSDYEEACGDLMQLRLEIDDSEELKNDWRLKTDLPVCEDLPTLYFTGTSSGYRSGQPRIQVRGTVSLAPGARQVRWRFLIR